MHMNKITIFRIHTTEKTPYANTAPQNSLDNDQRGKLAINVDIGSRLFT